MLEGVMSMAWPWADEEGCLSLSPPPAGEEHYVAFIRGRFVLTSWEMQNLPQCFLLQRDQAAHTSVFALLPGHTGDSDSQHPTIVRCVKRSSEPSRLSFSFSTLYLFVTMAPTHIAWMPSSNLDCEDSGRPMGFFHLPELWGWRDDSD